MDPIKQKYEFSDFARDMIQNNLATAMERHNMTNNALAQRTGLSWKTIERWVLGQTEPSLSKALLVCHKTGWDLSEIIGGILDGTGTGSRNTTTRRKP
jgi:DNA-binding XRE family transcriptional regulator